MIKKKWVKLSWYSSCTCPQEIKIKTYDVPETIIYLTSLPFTFCAPCQVFCLISVPRPLKNSFLLSPLHLSFATVQKDSKNVQKTVPRDKPQSPNWRDPAPRPSLKRAGFPTFSLNDKIPLFFLWYFLSLFTNFPGTIFSFFFSIQPTHLLIPLPP